MSWQKAKVKYLKSVEHFSLSLSSQSSLDDATDDWGIKVERVEIKDVKLPLQLQRAMAAEAEASREARAKVRRLCLPIIVFKGIRCRICHLMFVNAPFKGAVSKIDS